MTEIWMIIVKVAMLLLLCVVSSHHICLKVAC